MSEDENMKGIVMHNEIKELCGKIIAAKADENAATERRVDIEKRILEIVGCPDEGASTTEVDGYKIRVDQRINRKLDSKKWALICDGIPESLRPIAVKETISIETKGVRWLRENEPGYYKLLCQAMEEKPAKPSLKVEATI